MVGAGLAGLTAARALVAKGKSVIVLEARGRVGGRTLNHDLGNGKVTEVGGQWIGPTQSRIAALAKEFGIETFPTFGTGQNVYYARGERSTFSDDSPLGSAPPDPLALADVAATITQIDELARTIPVDAPWTAEKAEEYDGQTLETWLRANSGWGSNAAFRNLAAVAFEAILGSEARDVSFLFALAYTAGAGDEQNPGTFERLFNVRGGAQERRLVGGSQLMSLGLARRLGRRVVLRSPVRRITQSAGGGVRVESDRMAVACHHVIVAVPPVLAGRIAYEPGLPPIRTGLMQRMPMASMMKVEAVYERPFWRADGLNGQAVTDTGPPTAIFDNSPPDGAPGVLVGFVAGDQLRTWGPRSPADRRGAVLDVFAKCFGDQARKPADYFELDWTTEQWTGGGPVGVAAPGTLLRYGRALREPVGPHPLGGYRDRHVLAGLHGRSRQLGGARSGRDPLAALRAGPVRAQRRHAPAVGEPGHDPHARASLAHALQRDPRPQRPAPDGPGVAAVDRHPRRHHAAAAQALRETDHERAAADAAHPRAALRRGGHDVAPGDRHLQRAVGGDAHVGVAADAGTGRVDRDGIDVLRLDVEPVGLRLGGSVAPGESAPLVGHRAVRAAVERVGAEAPAAATGGSPCAGAVGPHVDRGPSSTRRAGCEPREPVRVVAGREHLRVGAEVDGCTSRAPDRDRPCGRRGTPRPGRTRRCCRS